MDTDELTRAMRAATDGLAPRPGFSGDVLRGGHRRRIHRRYTVATCAAAAAALVGGSAYLVLDEPAPGPAPAADLLTDQPTRGDLAGDTAFTGQALETWRQGIKHSPNADRGIFDDLRGDPHVYWAGTTPAGRAAIVTQEAMLHPHDNLGSEDADRTRTLVGLVATDPVDGKFKLVDDQFDAMAGRFMFGADDRTVLLVDRDDPLFVAYGATVQQGKITATWRRPTPADGVAIMELPAGTTPTQVRGYTGDQPPPDLRAVDGTLDIEPSSWYLYPETIQSSVPANTGLPWTGTELAVGDPGGPQVDPFGLFFDEISLKLSNGSAVGNYTSAWHIRAGLPDGRVAVLGDNQTGGAPSRLYAVLVSQDGTKTVVGGDEVDADAVLPVRLRLPDGQGWVVAAKGQSLSYRTDGDWSTPVQDAALLPDAATQVKVGEQVVDLG